MKEIKLDCRSIVIIIIWIYALAQPTCFIQSAFMDNIVQVGLVLTALLFMLAKKRELRIDSLSLLYLLLILTAVVPDICSGNIEGTITQAFSYVFPVLMYIIVCNAGDTERSIDLLYKLPIALGVLLGGWTAFGGILRFIGIPIGSNMVEVEKFGNLVQMSSYGFGIFASWGGFAGHTLYRLNSYFIEPSKFAMFLEVPFFLLLERYKNCNGKARRRTLFGLVCVSTAFLFSMSRAGMVSLLATIVYAKILKRNNKSVRNGADGDDIFKMIAAAFLMIIGALIMLNVLVALGKFFPGIPFLSEGITDMSGKANLVRNETVDSSHLLTLFLQHPFGSGFSSIVALNKVTNLANAFIFWTVIGGFFAIVILAMIYIKILLNNYIPAVSSGDYKLRGIANAFFSVTIHSLSYGTWMEPIYILLIVTMICMRRRELLLNNL